MTRTLKILATAFLFTLALSSHGSATRTDITVLSSPRPAPDFELPDLLGRTHRLSDYQGKVVILNFWASWCPPCRREMPSLQRTFEELEQDHFAMLAINAAEEPELVNAYAASMGDHMRFPVLVGDGSPVGEQWPLVAMPATFILDRDGRVIYKAIGARDWNAPEILHKIRQLASR